MYFKTLISLAFYAVLCLLSFAEGKTETGYAIDLPEIYIHEVLVIE